MLLQPATQKYPPNYQHQNESHLLFSSSLSFSSGVVHNSNFLLKQHIIFTSSRNGAHKSPVVTTCKFKSRGYRSYGTVDYERRPMLKWNDIYKKMWILDNSNLRAATLLNQMEDDGKRLSKKRLCRVIKELRKFRRHKYALEVYEWMNKKAERYQMTSIDTAIQLDLIAKVHGISSAEQYFEELPDALKNKRIYGSLLNAYVCAKMREKAESLIGKMRNRGYASNLLPFNVMMTIYLNLKDPEKVESLISEIEEKNIKFDIYTYNIWLSSCGSQGSLEKMERIFERMQQDTTINPNWTTFCTMATVYIKFGQLEKAEEYLKKIEYRLTSRDRMPYHYLISLYGSANYKDEVYRVWKNYKATFLDIPNLGYQTVISALVRMDDIEGAEKIYDEWLSVKSALSSYDRAVESEGANNGAYKLLNQLQKSFEHSQINDYKYLFSVKGHPGVRLHTALPPMPLV